MLRVSTLQTLLFIIFIAIFDALLFVESTFVEDRLNRYLFTNYSKFSRPEQDEVNGNQETIVVQMRLFFFKIHDIVEKDELIETTARLQFHWRDRRFEWNEYQFERTDEISLPASLVWLPNVELFNSATDFYTLTQDTRFSVKVHSDGSFWWHPTGNFATRCQLHLRFFPFDRQTCEYIFESPLLTSDKMKLIIRRNKPPIDFLHYIKSGKYELLGAGGRNYIRNVSKSTAFSGVAFYVKFRRKKTFYVLNIMLPIIVLAVLQLTTFFLPADDINRVHQSTTVLLAIVVFQTIAIQELPRISDSVPLLCVYVGIITLLSAFVIGESIVVGGMLRCTRQMPSTLRFFFKYRDAPETAAAKPTNNRRPEAASSGGVDPDDHDGASDGDATDELAGSSGATGGDFLRRPSAIINLEDHGIWVSRQNNRIGKIKNKSVRRRAQRRLARLMETPELKAIRREWKRLAMVLDWTMFVICTCIVGFTPVVMFVWMPLGESNRVSALSEYV